MSDDEQGCCGEGGAWSPKKGEPYVPGCHLCMNRPVYWRLPENRADGRPYVPKTPDESYAVAPAVPD